ncbi:MAG: hypothetical protein Q4C41_02015 [Eggerthellaceae bacterium]|nr:hypothetical protein [Eggerthellaceae bacterium]MDO5385452.1 hypothetical protein [Rikenellaceae bacterium]
MKSLPLSIECKHVVATMLAVMFLAFAIGFSLYRTSTPASIDDGIIAIADASEEAVQTFNEAVEDALEDAPRPASSE